jgi:hypothetical protein
MCALAGIDPAHVVRAGPAERELLIEVSNRVHKLVKEANKSSGSR